MTFPSDCGSSLTFGQLESDYKLNWFEIDLAKVHFTATQSNPLTWSKLDKAAVSTVHTFVFLLGSSTLNCPVITLITLNHLLKNASFFSFEWFHSNCIIRSWCDVAGRMIMTGSLTCTYRKRWTPRTISHADYKRLPLQPVALTAEKFKSLPVDQTLFLNLPI